MNTKIKIDALGRLVVLFMLSIVLASALSACGGGKVVKTVDDSADYKSAVALPPLNKKLGANQATKAVDQAPTKQQQISASSRVQNFTNAELLNINDKISRLSVDLPVEEALDYLADKLVASGMTVHHRNTQARRISIGCGDIQSAASTKKKSRWTLSGRRTIGRLEYCVLELDSNRDGTVVKVLNLNQQEVEKSAAEKIFQRILVN